MGQAILLSSVFPYLRHGKECYMKAIRSLFVSVVYLQISTYLRILHKCDILKRAQCHWLKTNKYLYKWSAPETLGNIKANPNAFRDIWSDIIFNIQKPH